MSIFNELYWEDANFVHFDEGLLKMKGFSTESIDALHHKGLPRWVAPHINIDVDYYESDSEYFTIGEDGDDQSIYIDLTTMFVLLGHEQMFINSTPSLFRKSLKLYAEMIEKALLNNKDALTNNMISAALIEEFRNRLHAIDQKAVEMRSFWIQEASKLTEY